MEEQKKKLSPKVIAAVAAVIVIAVICVFAFGGKKEDKDPKTAVIDAFKSLYSEEGVNPAEEIFGAKDMSAFLNSNNSEISIGANLVGSSEESLSMYNGSGFEIVTKNDLENKKTRADISILFGGMNLATANLYADETSIMLAVPQLSKKAFSLNYKDDLAGQIENSPYAGAMLAQMGITPDVVEEYFAYIDEAYAQTEEEVSVSLWDEFKEKTQAVETLKTSMTAEKAEAASFTIDGKEEKCNGYKAVVSKEASITFLKEAMSFIMSQESVKKQLEMQYGASVDINAEIDNMIAELEASMSDLELTVYTDSKGRMAAMDASTAVTSDNENANVSMHLELMGGNRLTENMLGNFEIKTDSENFAASFDKKGNYDKKVWDSTINLSLDINGKSSKLDYAADFNVESGDYTISFTGDIADGGKLSLTSNGIIDNIEKGKSLHIAVDSFKAEVENMGMIELSGNFEIKPLEGEVEAVEGEQMDILAAEKEEWDNVMSEVLMSGMGLMGKLQ